MGLVDIQQWRSANYAIHVWHRGWSLKGKVVNKYGWVYKYVGGGGTWVKNEVADLRNVGIFILFHTPSQPERQQFLYSPSAEPHISLIPDRSADSPEVPVVSLSSSKYYKYQDTNLPQGYDRFLPYSF
jgi:hypothetical protein